MLSNPKYGWCNFDLGDFHGTPSYLTDVPLDLLQAFADWFHKGSGAAYFDEEGSDFTLVLSHFHPYIIGGKEQDELYCFDGEYIPSLAAEVIKDVEANFDIWKTFTTSNDYRPEWYERRLKSLIKYLKGVLK